MADQQVSIPSPSTIPNLRNKLPKLEPRRRRAPPSNPVAVPETPPLPSAPELSSLSYQIPSRRILSVKDHELFLASPSYKLILAFIFGLSDAVEDAPISSVKDADMSDPVKAILSVLDEVQTLVEDTPPDDTGGSRFGNKLFRSFLDKAKSLSTLWHKRLGVTSQDAIAEVETYLLQSFGNRTRIDYGSGHELNFMTWLLCLYQLQILKVDDFKAIVLKIVGRLY